MNCTFALVLFVISFIAQVSFAQTEVVTPEDLSVCLQNYIQKRISNGEQVRWEHSPHYEFAGKYLSASWSTFPNLHSGSMFAFVGPQNPVSCDYPTNANGAPLLDKGFCGSNLASGDFTLEHTKYDSNGHEIKTLRTIAFIRDFKIYCF